MDQMYGEHTWSMMMLHNLTRSAGLNDRPRRGYQGALAVPS
jgi:hypothetical protein